MVREKVGVTIEVWVYGDDERRKEWGYVMAPWMKDSGGIPFANPDKGLGVIEEVLQRAYQESAELRRRRDSQS